MKYWPVSRVKPVHMNTLSTSCTCGSATSEDFVAIVERVSAVDLDDWFDAWVRAESIPERFPGGDRA